MKIEITTKKGETIRINTDSMPDIDVNAPMRCCFEKSKEKKWILHCKKHRLHPEKDCRGKYYEQYLRLCAEGLIK